MTIIGFGSFCGSPGVTTWTTILTSAISSYLQDAKVEKSAITRVLLIEADPAGNKVSFEYGFEEPAFTDYLVEEKADWSSFSHDLPGGGSLLGGRSTPKACSNLLQKFATPSFASIAKDQQTLAIVDLGRLHTQSPLLESLGVLSHLIICVRRSSNSEITFSNQSIQEILVSTEDEMAVGWGIVGGKGHSNKSVETFSNVPVSVEIPEDSTGATALFERPSKWTLRRSDLARAAYSFGATLVKNAQGSLQESL